MNETASGAVPPEAVPPAEPLSPPTVLEGFPESQLERIRVAVSEAERRSGGEIVTYLVDRCDEYPERGWRGALWGGVIALVGATLVHDVLGWWGGDVGLWALVPTLIGGLLGYLAASSIDGLGRALIRGDDLLRRVGLRAESAFLEEEVFQTQDRTGILLFVALFERRAVVLADEGIHRVVDDQEWILVTERLVDGMDSGDPVSAIIEAVERCGALLEAHEVTRRTDDRDELSDSPRVRRR